MTELAGEQEALRLIATLVANEADDEELFAAVAESVGTLFDADVAQLERDGGDTPLAVWGVTDDEVRSSLSCPIVVAGRPWGRIRVSSSRSELPEARLENFTELVATAIANSDSRAELRRLAAEQAALRRVATLVARGVPEADVFAAVTEEVVRVLGVDVAGMSRYEPDDTQTIVAAWPADRPHLRVGTRLPLSGEDTVAERVHLSGAPARIDDWREVPGSVSEQVRRLDVRASVASPIVVAGRLWGVMIVDSRNALPDGIEDRLASFIELVATAIANAHTRAEVQRLAEEQAALRRVASLVAGEASPQSLFAAVAEEMRTVLNADVTRIFRYESDGAVSVLAECGAPLIGEARVTIEGDNVAARVRDGRGTVRIDSYAEAPGPVAAQMRDLGVRSSVGAPIVVEGRLWGAAIASTTRTEPFPASAEARIAEFTELVATAIANAESRAELTASRARVVAAADAERRRIERNLHDGAQQRLVALGVLLRVAQAIAPDGADALKARLDEAVKTMREAVDELSEISRGLHPAILSMRGLDAALAVLARRSTVPVELDVGVDRRYDEAIEVAAYYVASEALANAGKHAQATRVAIAVREADGMLALTIADDGVGGADPARGSGLVGLRDRIEAVGGTLAVDSPLGAGTTLRVHLPV